MGWLYVNDVTCFPLGALLLSLFNFMSLLIDWRITSAVYTPQEVGSMNCFISHDSPIEFPASRGLSRGGKDERKERDRNI